jgi:hypothetical protein
MESSVEIALVTGWSKDNWFHQILFSTRTPLQNQPLQRLADSPRAKVGDNRWFRHERGEK